MDELHEERLVLGDAYVEACKACGHLGLAEAGVPSTPSKMRSVAGNLAEQRGACGWARTPRSGDLSTRRSELKRAVHYPPFAG